MTLRIMAMMALALSVSGCATGDDPTLVTGSIRPEAPALIADVAPDYAAAYLPQVAGRVEAVRQSSKPGHVFQTILYPNPGYEAGENTLSVSIAPPSSDTSYRQAPTRNEIMAEIRAALPGKAMAIAAAPGQNLQGPFGYATGPGTAGGACIFAWQVAKDISRSDETGFGKLARSRHAAKIRLRYCHPSMSEAALVSMMSGLRVREISDATIEMLRFAEGSGVPMRAGYASESSPASQAVAPAKPVVQSVSRPVVVEEDSPVRGAPRVLKPGELQASAVAPPDKPVTLTAARVGVAPNRKPPLVPLPGDL
ncbi:cellulose biosynthesis protein BcsN [Hoeflea alexandrii]|uniref:cellulose biosynthesis protein BcsN n=1 Tax=Hoeflea alexandrii TaxID=288436 RepID=UPI0022B01C3E|nr:cellulose biosynthesis protein BcsN [Hoeflea alexandrii]MCZ4290595.1 cellulose biosynthesis protein BcsN [Hoeflea alexandrii]